MRIGTRYSPGIFIPAHRHADAGGRQLADLQVFQHRLARGVYVFAFGMVYGSAYKIQRRIDQKIDGRRQLFLLLACVTVYEVDQRVMIGLAEREECIEVVLIEFDQPGVFFTAE